MMLVKRILNIKQSIGLFLIAAICFSCDEQPVLLYVGTDGSVQVGGEEQFCFRSVNDALDSARAIRKEHGVTPIEIKLLEGDYYLTKPLQISPLLNGLKLTGVDVSKVSVKGSLPLNLDWQSHSADIWVSDVDSGLDFDQLIVNGKPQILARYPNYDENGGAWQGHAEDAISPERLASWSNPQGALFHAMHGGRWGGFHYEVTGIDSIGNAMLSGGHQNNRPSAPHKTMRMVENVFEELDSPGEWFLDKDENKLYFWPESGSDLKSSFFEVAVLENLISVAGDEKSPVQDVTISGIKFEHTKRTFMKPYEQLLRSDWSIYRGGAIFFAGAEKCTIQECELTNLGGNVVFVNGYNRQVDISTNHIHDCGGSAICFVGDSSAVRSPAFTYREYVPIEKMDTTKGPKNELYPKDCRADGNLIYRIGRIEKQTAGVQIAMAMDITVSHNSIYDVPRAGINVGDGTWGGHILEYNDVFNTVLETSDHGSFNSWGRDRFWHPNRKYMDSITLANPKMPLWDAIHTTIIRNNRFRCDHGWDIDLDDGSTNYHIYNNLCLNGGIKLREGFHRKVENNITVNNSIHPHVWFANSEDIIRYNVLDDTYLDVVLSGWGKELDFNLFPNEVSMLKPQIYQRDLNSGFGDPLFIEPMTMNYTVAEGSPALDLGFKNFPMDQFGVVDEKFKAIAKKPDVPSPKEKKVGVESAEVKWLRNDIKDVTSEQEQSAYGLNTPEGVIILSTWRHSPAVKNGGIKKGDVILQAGGKKVSRVVDFLDAVKKHQESGTISVLVMRNQKEVDLTLNLK